MTAREKKISYVKKDLAPKKFVNWRHDKKNIKYLNAPVLNIFLNNIIKFYFKSRLAENNIIWLAG